MGLGLTAVLAVLGGIREILGHGTLLSGIDLVFGDAAKSMVITVAAELSRLPARDPAARRIHHAGHADRRQELAESARRTKTAWQQCHHRAGEWRVCACYALSERLFRYLPDYRPWVNNSKHFLID